MSELIYSKNFVNRNVFSGCELPLGFNVENNVYLNTKQEESKFERAGLDLSLNSNLEFDVDELIDSGKTFYNDEKRYHYFCMGVSVAFQEALDFAGFNGYVATMPELIAAKLKADKSHDFWQNWYFVHTEENVGVDQKGRFYAAGEPVLVVVNGGGILTPEKIKEYACAPVTYDLTYDPKEFDDLLDGKLPHGESLNLFRFEEIRNGVSSLPHRFGVVMPYSIAQSTDSAGYYRKKKFMENPLVIARSGGVENLEAYFEKAKDSDGVLGCYHPFERKSASVSRGRVLFLSRKYGGLRGEVDMENAGRFVGVRK